MRHLKYAVLLASLVLLSCASNPPHDLEQVHMGMDKDKVLEVAGNPKFTFRDNMQDHWVYTYFSKNQEWRREVVFDEGVVTRLTQPLGKNDWVKDLEKSANMEEYEKKARDHQKKAGQFKSADGQPDNPETP